MRLLSKRHGWTHAVGRAEESGVEHLLNTGGTPMRTRQAAIGPRRHFAPEKNLLIPAAIAAALAVAFPAFADGDGQATAAPAGVGATSEKSDAVLQEVVVTGSRIKRRDYESQSPIVTVNSDAFENKSSVSIEATLNQLPQF